MSVLLDTHVLLWWLLDDRRLSERAREIIADGTSAIYVSAASACELALKASLGRLLVPQPVDLWLHDRLQANRFMPLAVSHSHAVRAGRLPVLHRDPWDRMLVAQSQLERLPLVSADPAIGRYDVEVIW